MDNYPAHSINLSKTPQISLQACGPCIIWFCEQPCPTGAIEVDREIMDKLEDLIKSRYRQLAKSMKEFKDIRSFRNYAPPAEENQAKPLYKIKKHPRLIMCDGMVKVRKSPGALILKRLYYKHVRICYTIYK
jgi:formate hydrogenlyase subunit 6/NADH:ubiquinone oxidoreductase subunit I